MVPAQDEHEGGLTYRDAGVDIDKATASLTAIGKLARSTMGAGTSDADFGHFGGVFPLPSGPDRLLVASADGIGTKIKIAFVIGGWAHKRVGGDLVRHCVNDVLACGARPLFFLDYIAMGSLDTEALEGLVEGMAEACRENGLALIGGETAEMPGLYAAGEYDAAGFIVGEVAPGRFVDGSAVRAGDRLIGFPSTGLHTNGYSLARKIIGEPVDQSVRSRSARCNACQRFRCVIRTGIARASPQLSAPDMAFARSGIDSWNGPYNRWRTHRKRAADDS